MFRKALRSIVERAWLRIGLAAALLIVGLAPVGAPILSDNAVRQSLGAAPAPTVSPAYIYQYENQADGTAQIRRAAAGSGEWATVASIPQTIEQVAAVSGRGQKLVYARSADSIWRSEDAGATWARTATLPSHPLSFAVSQDNNGLLLAGTAENGLFASWDRGATWQPSGDAALIAGPGILAVTAVSFNPTDERILYVTADFTMATPQGSHTAHEALVSVDSASHWFPLQPKVSEGAAQGATASGQLAPVTNQPIAFTAASASGAQTYALPSTAVLLDGLESVDPGLRAAAARALGLNGDPSVTPALLKHLSDEDQAAGDRAAEAIGRLGDRSALPSLRVALDDQDEVIRARAAYALGLLQDETSVPQLAAMLLNDGPLARPRAAGGLAAIGSPAAISALVAPLADEELTSGRQAAMQALTALGRPAVPQLQIALQSPEPVVRRNAAEMLGWMRSDASVPALAAILTDADPQVRQQAAWALGEIGTLPAQKALAQAVSGARDQATRQAATQGLARAQQVRNERESIVETPLSAAMHALTQVPASRWTFLALVIVLAAMLLVLTPRQAARQRA